MSASGARRNALAVTAVATCLLALVTGCGKTTTAPGDDVPKRSLEPRTEALRFFPADTEAVALVDTASPAALGRLDRAMEPITEWTTARDRLATSLSAAGIEPEEILRLSREPGPELDLPRPEIAAGEVPGSGSPASRMLYTLATEQGVALDRLFKEAAAEGGLQAAGQFDEARLYRGPGLDFAVRDGVLIAATGLNRLQQAIARRDGDRALQLDEAPINELLNQLPEPGPLHAYSVAIAPARALLVPVLAELPITLGETKPGLTQVGLTASGSGGGLNVDLIAKLDSAPKVERDAVGGTAERPLILSLSRARIEAVLRSARSGPLLKALPQIAPVASAVWIDGDQLHARLRTGRD